MGKIKETGNYLNGARFVNILFCFPVIILLAFSYPLFIWFGWDENVVYHATRFLYGIIPGVIFYALMLLHVEYLNSFRKILPGILIQIFGLAVQGIFVYIFLVQFRWGIFGVGLANSVSSIAMFIVSIFTLFYYDVFKEAMFMPSLDASQWGYLKEFMAIGIPSMAMVLLEVGGLEILSPLTNLIS